MEDRRHTHRRRMLKAGKIVLSDSTVIDCLIRDLSAGGAHVAFGAPISLPDAFHLLIGSSNLIVPAEPVWQHGLAAGLRFTGPGETTEGRRF